MAMLQIGNVDASGSDPRIVLSKNNATGGIRNLWIVIKTFNNQ